MLKRVIVRVIVGLVGLLIVLALVVLSAGRGWFGGHEEPGEVTEARRSPAVVASGAIAQRAAAESVGVSESKQILFGDLHVHTTFSFDAFLMSLPIAQGEGAHPPADACDFARYCSTLDFWSINDHAEGITPRHWRETVETLRQCNEVAGDPANPDTVAFLGWEWTQVGNTPEEHYGHKNVVLAHTDDDRIPTRPIGARGTVRNARRGLSGAGAGLGVLALLGGDQRFHDFARYIAERREMEECALDVDVHDLPDDCLETAENPGELFRKLDEWGHDSIVIPHGTTWGFYTPPGSTWDKQLTAAENDPDRQILLEIYSGHGDSDVYRDWRAVEFDANGTAICPEPRANYLPPCWRAGEIIRERCAAAGETDDECEGRAVEARAIAAAAGGQAHLTVPGSRAEDWLDAGQCRDCAEPAFNYRPGGSAQYVMALRNFDDPNDPQRFRFGFMSSSDNHFARAGTGYKEIHRRGMTESNRRGDPPRLLRGIIAPPAMEPVAEAVPFDRESAGLTGFAALRAGAPGIVLHDRRSGRRTLRGARPRSHLGRHAAPRGLRHHRAAHPSLVRSAQSPRLTGSEAEHGRTGGAEHQPDLPGSRRGLLRPAPGLSRLREQQFEPRTPRPPLQGRMLQPVGSTPDHHSHRGDPHSAAESSRRARGLSHRRPLAELRLRARPGWLLDHLRGSRALPRRAGTRSTTFAPSRSPRRA